MAKRQRSNQPKLDPARIAARLSGVNPDVSSLEGLRAGAYVEVVAQSSFFALANAVNKQITKAQASRQSAMNQTMESLRQAAGINRVPDIPVQSVLPNRAAGLDLQTALMALSQRAPVLSGRLAASFLNGESWLVDNGDGTATLDSAVPYARINDLGGDTGKNGRTHISPSYYVAAASASAGFPIVWTDGRLAGAGGVGPRGVDRRAAQPLGTVSVGGA